MTEQKSKYTTRRKRRSNNPNGRTKELVGGKYMKFYADAETIRLIKALVGSGQAKNQSQAIRKAIRNFTT
jgi:hypothetical protein